MIYYLSDELTKSPEQSEVYAVERGPLNARLLSIPDALYYYPPACHATATGKEEARYPGLPSAPLVRREIMMPMVRTPRKATDTLSLGPVEDWTNIDMPFGCAYDHL